MTDPAVSARGGLIDSRCRVTLQDCISEWRSGAGVAGVSAAVRVNGQLQWTSADTRTGVLAADALCPIYSITKTLTAMCALRLAERGALGLSDPVAAWCPDVGLRDEVTIAHLLRHTSGLGDYGPLPEYHDAVRSHPSDPWTRRQFLDAVLPRGMRFEPGGGWAYSNIGYMLLREVLQRAAGRTFADTIHDLVAAPLALQHTRVVDTIDGWSNCVPGYGPEVDVNGQIVDVRRVYHPGWCAPGVAVSTAEEVTLVFDALLAGQILEPGSLAEMLTLVPLSADPHERHAYGMGIGSESASPRGANYGHGGGGPGYDLDVTIFPDTRFGRVAIAVFVCSSGGGQRWSRTCEEQLLSCAFA